MKTLIEDGTNGPMGELYKKRLVRELNADINGFYAPHGTGKVRCNRAKLVMGEIRCHSLSMKPAWFTPSDGKFENAYGAEIVASRQR